MRQRAGVSTPGHGQGEGPGGYKFPRSGEAVDVGRGRSERSERSPARYWQPAGKTSVTRSRGQEKLFCTRKATAGMSRGQEGLFCTREAVAYTSRGQRGPFCTREDAASRSRGQRGLFCTREAAASRSRGQGGRGGRFAHERTQQAAPGGREGCFAHGKGGSRQDAAAGGTGISEKKVKSIWKYNFLSYLCSVLIN